MDIHTPLWTLIAVTLAGPLTVISTMVIGFSIAAVVVVVLIRLVNVSDKE